MTTEQKTLSAEDIRFRFFRDLVAGQRLAVFKAFGVYPDNCTESLNHSIERRLLDQILNRRADASVLAAQLASQPSQAPIKYEGRMRPTWAPEGKSWTNWEEITRESYETYLRLPVYNDWQYEARALYSAPPSDSSRIAELQSQLEAERKYRLQVQKALMFWLPIVPNEPEGIRARATHDAMLLIGYEGDDEQSAEDLGWITWAAVPAEQRHSKANQDLAVERRRQIEAEGYDPLHDDEHVSGEISAYAAFYAMPPAARDWPATETGYGSTWGEAIVPEGWVQPKTGDRRRELVKAGALILAEIERLDREAMNKENGNA